MPQASTSGSVIIYTGDGKGKTSAAIGTAVRASGHGLNVFIVLFMKGSSYDHGEVRALEGNAGITIKSFGQPGWVKKGSISQGDIEQAQLALSCARSAVLSSQYDFVIMDEVNAALDCGLIEYYQLESIVKNRPSQVSMVLTGRNADPRLFEMADIVTEMKPIKYRYNKGNNARRGLDY
ncbi:MAG: cob(I)yrinic acid a,c-diamide adenosyltransferase [Dehalococcoidales bacterium]|nr:cob(I)yrinic acid a,c-diamide adenosyltransferase [Dehalococcoidales bacterium]MDX9803817.1 cob(I)yrinic acid a,c-diamide adenosyltransferase [Dehalococcoidales bacterium]